MYVRTYVCMYLCTYVRTYVCMYVCTYVCMYVCMYVYRQICNNHNQCGIPESFMQLIRSLSNVDPICKPVVALKAIVAVGSLVLRGSGELVSSQEPGVQVHEVGS